MNSFAAIVIDLKGKDLVTTSKYYARIQNALSNDLLPKFSMRFLWNPPKNSKICTSSVAKYFNDLGYEVNLNQTDCKLNIEYGLKAPLLGPESDDPIEIDGKSAFYATPNELVEYAGLVALSCDLEGSEYLNSYSFTGHSVDVGSALTVKLKGMFSCDLIRMLFKNLKYFTIAYFSRREIIKFFFFSEITRIKIQTFHGYHCMCMEIHMHQLVLAVWSIVLHKPVTIPM